MIKIMGFVLLFLVPAANALDNVIFSLEELTADNFELQGIRIALTGIKKPSQLLELSIDKLTLPAAFDKIVFVNIRCTDFSWQERQIACQQGVAEIDTEWLDAPRFTFSFTIDQQQKRLTLNKLQVAGGRLELTALEKNGAWQIAAKGQAIKASYLQKLISTDEFELNQGKIRFDINSTGQGQQLNDFDINADLEDLAAQSKDFLNACEGLSLNFQLNGQREYHLWQWQNHISFSKGTLFSDPYSIIPAAQPITLSAEGSWHEKQQRLKLRNARFDHPEVFSLQGSAELSPLTDVAVERADLDLQIVDLLPFSEIYLSQKFFSTTLQGLSFSGQLQARFTVVQQAFTDVSLSFEKLGVQDENARIALNGGNGNISWSKLAKQGRPSILSWKLLKIYALPLGPATIKFLTEGKAVNLLESTTLPILDGAIRVNWFSFLSGKQEEPDVRFEGEINDVPLAALAKAMGWKSLIGNISGNIPGVHFRQGKLGIDGELHIKVFDGRITIKDLVLAGLFGDLPQLYSEIEIDNLDLYQLTQISEFGSMQGRLSGFVRDLYLENWHPVSFYAWLGTPEDDDSRHRISQKAVNNLASIGGGGAADLISRSFLGVFETFGYDRVGIGCYLHHGVCQLMGMEKAEQGYYIVKGGGLPRIDVIGYNPQINWKVLLQRLERL